MKRAGFTLVELLLGGAILATISFGALIGMLRISAYVDRRGELMAADGFCWDLAWKLFNEDEEFLRWVMTHAEYDPNEEDPETPPEIMQSKAEMYNAFPARPTENNIYYLSVSGEVMPDQDNDGKGFLSHLRWPDSPPICYITFSNRWDSATSSYDENGVYISVNLEWGPQNHRRALMPHNDMSPGTEVFNQPITIYRSYYSRVPVDIPKPVVSDEEKK